MSDPTWDEESDAGWYRRTVGHRIERTMNRMLGLLLGAVGLWAAYVTLSSDEFTLGSHWFGLVAAAVLLFLSRLCFKARKAIITDFGDDTDFPVTPHRKP